jgi:hypothetical protein
MARGGAHALCQVRCNSVTNKLRAAVLVEELIVAVLVKKCMHTMASFYTTHPWYHRVQCEWSVTLASVLVLVKSRIGSQSVISFTVSLSFKYIICLLIHLNYDSSISNKQSRSVIEIFFPSVKNEHQSPCSVKHSKVVFFLFQNLRQCGRPGGNDLCHWWD